jgi:hypothetical protein
MNEWDNRVKYYEHLSGSDLRGNKGERAMNGISTIA